MMSFTTPVPSNKGTVILQSKTLSVLTKREKIAVLTLPDLGPSSGVFVDTADQDQTAQSDFRSTL